MKNGIRHRQLADLIKGSQNLLEMAEAGDWDVVTRMQGQHRQLAEALFSEPVTAAEARVVAEAVNQVLTINARIAELGADARSACQREVNSNNYRRHAVKAYTATRSRENG